MYTRARVCLLLAREAKKADKDGEGSEASRGGKREQEDDTCFRGRAKVLQKGREREKYGEDGRFDIRLPQNDQKTFSKKTKYSEAVYYTSQWLAIWLVGYTRSYPL